MNFRNALTGMLLWLGVMLCCHHPLQGSIKMDLSSLQRLAILENGRIKPLDTYARNLLKKLSGKSRYRNFSAGEWLARVLFTPAFTLKDEIFLINNPELLDAVDIPSHGRGRYSYEELSPGFDRLNKLARELSRKEGRLSPVESEIQGLYSNIIQLDELMRTFAYSVPHPHFKIAQPETAQWLQLNPKTSGFSFLDILPTWPRLKERAALIQVKPRAILSPAELEIINLMTHVQEWAASPDSSPFAVIPSPSHHPLTWISPWETLSRLEIHPAAIQLAQAAEAYRNRRFKTFSLILDNVYASVQVPALTAKTIRHLRLEIIYNRLDPFFITEILAVISLFILLLSLRFWRKWFYRISLGLMMLALIPHTAGIILRMLISGRPPVTNLYETFVFVAWIGALAGLWIELSQRKSLGLFCADASTLIFLFIAGKFSLDGDTMGMLTAVLNSNWWLAVHVITISMGYAGCIISAITGHVFLIQKLLQPADEGSLASTYRALIATLSFGLTFTFIGTVMGGVWADQSWGRFWGWDPKENGALVIILWCAVLLHARAARLIQRTGMAAGSIGLIISVILAWFGVNLLGVGKHSYGFTSGVSRGLFIFLLAEVSFLIVMLVVLLGRKKSAEKPLDK